MIDFADLFDRSPNPYMLLDPDLRFVAVNQAYLRTTGRAREELLGARLFDAFPGDPADPDDNVTLLRDSLMRVFATGQADVLGLIRYAIPRQTPQGIVFDERYWSATHTPVLDANGRVAYVLQNTMDVTEFQRLKAELEQARRLGEEPAPPAAGALPLEQVENNVFARAQVIQRTNRQLDEQRRHLLKLFEEAPGFMAFLRGPEHVFELANSAYLRLVQDRDVVGHAVAQALPEAAEQGYLALLDRVYASGEPFVGRGMRIELQARSGLPSEQVFVDFVYQPVLDVDGAVAGIFVQGHDITAQAMAQAELERYRGQLEDLVQARTQALEASEAERRAAEAALLQAQKLEAVGKLTGGVAHDFNNVLQVIGANLELLAGEHPLPATALHRMRAAREAVERGAKLASQLLAFARRQPLNPVVFHLGQRLRHLQELLQRTLGEEVDLHVDVAADAGNIEADVHQFDNMVLNLAINARDAMPMGGRLDIACRAVDAAEPELAPGRYVQVTVTDTGHGMSEHVLERVFEPFFTTKSEGQGTGLGLSMVYGFIQQSGGAIRLHSSPGAGTRVSILLPVSDQAETPLADAPSGPMVGGTESVLVVEDDAAVREGVVGLLRTLGYRVLEAADAQAALAIIESNAPIDLLFTDVVMPGPVRSPELARRARALRPGLAVLFTSGYTEDTIFHGGRLDPGVELLGKPYQREDLARRVRQMLGVHPAHGVHAAQAASSTPAMATQAMATPAALAVPGLRILLVEDDDANRLLTGELLSILGHQVYSVADADHAQAQLQTDPDWDLLLTDVELRGQSGIALAARVRERHPAMRVVFISGHSAQTLRDRGVTDPVLHKPYGVEQLQSALRG